jgi:hypothetical protein
MMAMEQHQEERKEEEFYKVNQTNTVNFILNHILGQMDQDFLEVTSDDINAALNVLDVNAFEIRGERFSARGVYPLTAMMNSVCTPNTQVRTRLQCACSLRFRLC